MSYKLSSCCQKQVLIMQGTAELGCALRIFLAASPFVLILPDLMLPATSQEAIETLGEKVVEMSAEKVMNNVVDTSTLPDFADAVRDVNEVTILRLHSYANIHSLRHQDNVVGKIWATLKETYDPNGKIRSGGGWDLNPFW